MDAAARVDPLHRRDVRQQASAAMRRHLEFEPGNVVGRLPRNVGGRFGDHGAAVGVLPGRPGIVAADGLAIEDERGDGLAEPPGEFAVIAGFAFVDLRPLGMERHDRVLAWRGDCGRNLRRYGGRQDRGGDEGDCKHQNAHGMSSRLPCGSDYAIAFFKFSSTLSRKPVVESHFWSAPTSRARSLVMKPDSTVPTVTGSKASANFASPTLFSSMTRW